MPKFAKNGVTRSVHLPLTFIATMPILLSAMLLVFGCMSEVNIYAQRILSDGSVSWTPEGVPVCTVFGNQNGPQMISDGEGGAIILWGDPRPSLPGLYAQRVLSSGTMAWKRNGIWLRAGGSGAQMTSDGAGGAIVVWYEEDMYAQRFLPDGTTAWSTTWVPICTAPYMQMNARITPDGNGGAIVAWMDGRDGATSDYDIYAQRVHSDGTVAWTEDGVAICTAERREEELQIISDGSGGAIIAWQDSRDLMETEYNVYVQRVLSDGTPAWTLDGVPICTSPGSQENPRIAPDDTGGVFITWMDGRDQETTGLDVYAQRVLSDGSIAWALNGVPICAMEDDQRDPRIISDGTGRAILVWYDRRNYAWNGYDIYGQKVDGDGNAEWTLEGVAFCTAADDQWGAEVTTDGAGGVVISWWDGRGGTDWDLYAQRVLPDGSPAWIADGVAFCTVTGLMQGGPPINHNLTTDGLGGAIFAWDNGSRI